MKKWVCLCLLTLVLHGAQADERGDRDTEKSGSHRYNQDDARDALRKGQIMPLADILVIVAKRQPGMVIQVDLETRKNRAIYEIDVLTDDGRRRELQLDARHGEILSVKDE